MNAVVPKPIRPARLLEAISTAVAERAGFSRLIFCRPTFTVAFSLPFFYLQAF